MDGRGSAALFSERYPLLITETCGHTRFYDEFWQKTTHFLLFFANFWITHSCLWKICRKRDPCLENLGPNNQPIRVAHTRTFNMLCTPLPRGLSVISLSSMNSCCYEFSRPRIFSGSSDIADHFLSLYIYISFKFQLLAVHRINGKQFI